MNIPKFAVWNPTDALKRLSRVESLMTTKDVGELLLVTYGTVKRWRINGRGPAFIKIERSIRYNPADVAKFIEHRYNPYERPVDADQLALQEVSHTASKKNPVCDIDEDIEYTQTLEKNDRVEIYCPSCGESLTAITNGKASVCHA